MCHQMPDCTGQFLSVISLDGEAILKADCVVLAGCADNCNAACPHHFKSYDAEGFVTAVRQNSVGGTVAGSLEVVTQEEPQIQDICIT